METRTIYSDEQRVGNREIAVEISQWEGDDGETRRTVKIQVWNLANRKNYAIWLPINALPVLMDMLGRSSTSSQELQLVLDVLGDENNDWTWLPDDKTLTYSATSGGKRVTPLATRRR
jgi:hypothetical protein